MKYFKFSHFSTLLPNLSQILCRRTMSSDLCIESGNQKLDCEIKRWLEIDKNPTTHAEVVNNVANQRWEKLGNVMLGRQKFGTAGLRAKMAAGYKCINDVVVLQTAQGICSYLKKVLPKEQMDNGIVVGFDGRYNSRRYAQLSAKVFATNCVPVILFDSVCPTPYVSFSTRQYKCVAGIMVTASHNPKEDNGYKVYWGNGSQIISPHDDNILDEILCNLDIPDEHWNIENIYSNKLISNKLSEVDQMYQHFIRTNLTEDVFAMNRKASIDVVYTAMHGVGYNFVEEAFATAGLKRLTPVLEQRDPDPEFSTVKFPNPEEAGALDLSIKLTEKKGFRLLLANDPDADRLAAAEYDPCKKQWTMLTGNQLGTLLGWWMLIQYTRKTANTKPMDQVYIIASIVSSKMLKAIADHHGCKFLQTLTGFKWMGNKSLLLLEEGKVPLFAFEEALGYMCLSGVPDKDGVSAAVQMASFASELYLKNSCLRDELSSLYAKFGYHVSYNSYYLCYDPNTIRKIFDKIRNFDGPGKYPTKVASGAVVFLHDLPANVKIPSDKATGDAASDLKGTGLDIKYTSGEMIIFRFDNGLSVTIRTSGTEPKIKYYTELVVKASCLEEQQRIQNDLKKTVGEFVEVLLQPKENNLKAPSK